jgi:hypothetical protein
MAFQNMTNRLYITQVDQTNGQVDKVKVISPDDCEPFTAVITPKQVRQLMAEEDAVFDTIVAETSHTARVIPYGKDDITTKATPTDEDNLLKLPSITLEAGENRRSFEWLQNWIQQHFPLPPTPGTAHTNRDQTVS